MAGTRVCEACDVECADTETKCPNPECGVEFEELESTVAAVETAQRVIEKRKAKSAPPAPAPAPSPETVPPVKRSRFIGLGNALRKKGN